MQIQPLIMFVAYSLNYEMKLLHKPVVAQQAGVATRLRKFEMHQEGSANCIRGPNIRYFTTRF
jgi:hypothetical protein